MSMLESLKTLQREGEQALAALKNSADLPEWYRTFLGRKGKLTDVLRGFGSLPAEERPAAGKAGNEVKQALAYYQTKPEWLVRYCHSLMPNVSPVYKDVAANPELTKHPFFDTKKRTINEYYVESLKHGSNTGNELLQGVNPLAGIVHGRAILAQTA